MSNSIPTITIPLNEKQVQEQKRAIDKYTGLLNKEIRYGDLMNLDNVNSYAAIIKNCHHLIKHGVTFEGEYMVQMNINKPGAVVSEIPSPANN